MDFSQMNNMYIVTRVDIKNGSIKVVGLFRGKENADHFVDSRVSSEFLYECNKVVTDF